MTLELVNACQLILEPEQGCAPLLNKMDLTFRPGPFCKAAVPTINHTCSYQSRAASGFQHDNCMTTASMLLTPTSRKSGCAFTYSMMLILTDGALRCQVSINAG